MKRLLVAVALTTASIPAIAADVGVSISVGQPGFYGQIDIGSVATRPEVVYAQPVVVERPVIGYAPPPPMYLVVPPGHQRHWKRYCHEYNACGRPVYFVRQSWYNNVYVPRYREMHRRGDWRDGGNRGGDWRDGGRRGGDWRDGGRRGGGDGGRGGDWRDGGNGGGHGRGHGRD